MAQASIARIDRSTKAAGILDRQEVEPTELAGLWHVTDTLTGSGKIHTTSLKRCSCADFTYRGLQCKHMTAVARAEAELATYAAGWDADAQALRVTCPDCGTALQSDVCYIGGKGYCAFLVCVCCQYGRPA